MQYIFSEKEYKEYINLKTLYSKKSNKPLSEKLTNVYNVYVDNPGITYGKASKLLKINISAVYNHVQKLIEL